MKGKRFNKMATIDLSKYGITGTTEVVYNPSYEMLFEEETKPELEGYEKGQVSELGAVNVMTGIYTGRSPKDKFIVVDENSKDTVWWTSDEYKNDNHPATQEAWNAVKDIAIKELSNKRLFVVDAFCGANKDTRMAVSYTHLDVYKRQPQTAPLFCASASSSPDRTAFPRICTSTSDRIIFPRTRIFQFQPHQHEFLPSAVACQKAPRISSIFHKPILLIQSHCGLIFTDHLKFQLPESGFFRAVNAGAGQCRTDSLSPVFPQDTDAEIRAVP